MGLNGISKVVTSTGPSPTMVQQPVLQQRSVSLTDVSQFPALGNNGTMLAPTQTQWGFVHGSASQPNLPNGMPAPKVVLGQDMMRAGVQPNSQHPRNAFVKKPHKQPEGSIIQERTPGAIDWTASGTTAFQQQVMQALQAFANNPAHLSPYVTQTVQPSLTSLKMAPAPAVSLPQPKVMKNANPMKQFGKPQLVYQRKC